MYLSTRTRIMEAATEHGWQVSGDLSELRITRGPVSLLIEFSTTGGIRYAGTESHRFTGSDRCSQVIAYLRDAPTTNREKVCGNGVENQL